MKNTPSPITQLPGQSSMLPIIQNPALRERGLECYKLLATGAICIFFYT